MFAFASPIRQSPIVLLSFTFPTGGNFNPNPFVISLSLFLRGNHSRRCTFLRNSSKQNLGIGTNKGAIGFHFPRFDLFVETDRDRAFGSHLVKIELRAFHLAPHRQEMSFQLLGGWTFSPSFDVSSIVLALIFSRHRGAKRKLGEFSWTMIIVFRFDKVGGFVYFVYFEIIPCIFMDFILTLDD